MIQVTEAAAVWHIKFTSGLFNDITGINSFPNLRTIDSYSAFMYGINIQNLEYLEKISFGNNLFWFVATLNNLPKLKEVYLNDIKLTSLTINNCPLLEKLASIDNTNFDNFTHSELSSLKELIIEDGYQSTLLDITKFPNIKKLALQNVNVSTLNFEEAYFLEDLSLLLCNNLSSLDIINMPALKKAEIVGTNLSGLNFGTAPLLTHIILGGVGPSPTINLSGCTALDKLSVYGNNIRFLNLKNGKSTYSQLNMNINNQNNDEGYICVDNADEETSIFYQNNYNVVIGDYCSFTPGGNFNTMQGTVFFDSNGDGCNPDEGIGANIKMRLTQLITTGYGFTSNLSQYKFHRLSGNFTLKPDLENNWFTVTPASVNVNFPAGSSNNTVTNNFCITPNGVHPDVEVVVYPITNAQPGFDAYYKIVYKNKGNQAISGAVTFNYDDATLDFVSATPIQSASAGGQLTFNYSNLLPFEDRSVEIKLNLNGPMETPPLNNGDYLNFSAAITPTAGDETPAGNTFSLKQEIVGSYDPNDIICLEGNIVSPAQIGDYLNYIVNFENTGTAPTTFIVVRVDVNPAQYDISTLRVMNTSHASDIRVTGNRIEFIMPTAVLAAGDHGNILFKMKTKSNLVQGNMVKKKASIYFDYNFPIVTNDANTTFQALSTGSWTKDDSVKVYPNPSAGMVMIEASTAINSIELYDVQGRLLEIQKAHEISASFDITTRAKGIYFVKVKTDSGVKVEKIIRE